jgi:hypothetical protein
MLLQKKSAKKPGGSTYEVWRKPIRTILLSCKEIFYRECMKNKIKEKYIAYNFAFKGSPLLISSECAETGKGL